MSGRFVSAGTISSSGEVSKDTAPGGNDGNSSSSTAAKPLHDGAKSKEWEVVQQELEAERRRREEQRVKAATGESEKSLYDILQANKGLGSFSFLPCICTPYSRILQLSGRSVASIFVYVCM
jgi:hypothetical protein